MRQFSLEEYLKNPERKVVTKDGQNVRILATNRKSTCFPVVGLVDNNGTEEVFHSTISGQFTPSGKPYLFFAPEKHEGWVNVYRAANGKPCTTTDIYTTKEEAEFGESLIAVCKIEWSE